MKYRLLKDLKAGDTIEVNLGEGITEEVKEGRWKPVEDDYYHYILDGYMEGGHWTDDYVDEWRYSQGNCFKTREEAEEYKEVLEIEAELRELSEDIEDRQSEVIWNIGFDADEARPFRTEMISYIKWGHDYNFNSKESAQAAIDKIGEDRLKKYLLYKW